MKPSTGVLPGNKAITAQIASCPGTRHPPAAPYIPRVLRFPHVILIGLATVGMATAAPKIALVRIGEIYLALPEAAALEASLETKRKEIPHDPRADALRSAMQELRELRESIKKIPRDDRTTMQQALQQYGLKRQETLTLRNEFEAFKESRTSEINSGRVEIMTRILAEIHRVATEVGKARGYDWVLDAEGRSNTGLPIVIYAKEPHDITAEVLASLIESTPAKDTTETP